YRGDCAFGGTCERLSPHRSFRKPRPSASNGNIKFPQSQGHRYKSCYQRASETVYKHGVSTNYDGHKFLRRSSMHQCSGLHTLKGISVNRQTGYEVVIYVLL
uniref:Uncharacterized protein n=1 Tax=Ciona intestinalis TaxID=7719 RepID=H2XK12_CIOIN